MNYWYGLLLLDQMSVGLYDSTYSTLCCVNRTFLFLLFLITWFTDLIFEKMGRSVEIKIKLKFHYTHYFNFV